MKICLLCIGLVGVTVGSQWFYGWSGHSVDFGIERHHDGFEVLSSDTQCSIFVIVITPAQTYGLKRCNRLRTESYQL
jgi:hypothetical protein